MRWSRRSTTTPTSRIPAAPWWASSRTKKRTPCSNSAPRTAAAPSSNQSPASWVRRRWNRRSITSPTGARRNGPAARTRPAMTWADCTATARTSTPRWDRSTGPPPTSPPRATSTSTAPFEWGVRRRPGSSPPPTAPRPAAKAGTHVPIRKPFSQRNREVGQMRYVVGYSANARGRDAVNLAVSLARGRGASLDLVVAIPDAGVFNAAHAPAAGYDSYLHQQASEWLDEALALVPADVPAQTHIRSGESDAQTLIEACDEFQADMLIIGATSHGLFKRFTVGSVASALLHAATVPVALAPHGYHRREALTRVSCGLGDRPGAEELLDYAVSMATNRHVPLRVVSLLELDGGDAAGAAGAADAARDYAAEHLAAALPGGGQQAGQQPKTEVA